MKQAPQDPDRHGDRESELLIERWGRLVCPRGAIERDRPVLVVEDDQDVRDMLRVGLEMNGFDTVGAADGAQALRIASASPPQAILLDLGLPHMSGRAFLRHWRERSPAASNAVPVVVVSGNEDARAAADEIGADAAVPKPVDLERLTAVLRRLTDPPSAAA